MQTVKTSLFVLFCIALLSACGLKGPLYLEDENAGLNSASEQQAGTGKETGEDTKKPEKKKPSSS